MKFSLLFAMLLVSTQAFSNEAAKKTKAVSAEQVGKSKPVTIKVAPENISQGAKEDEADQVITNRRLRADAGSLSKWSGSLYFNYQGGSAADPLKPNRPNIVAGADALALQNFTGTVGIRYRLTALDSITANTGFFITTPFHDRIKTKDPKLKESFEDTNRKLNVNDPSLKYIHLDKIWGLQSVTNFTPTLITNNQQHDVGYRSSWLLSQTFMKDFGNGFSLGLAGQSVFYTYEVEDPANNGKIAKNVLGLYPAAEYVINDTFNVRTVFGTWVYEQTRAAASDTWVKRKVYQSVGLGISLGRDVFLYPNIQYIPSDIRSDRTNIAISANVNVF